MSNRKARKRVRPFGELLKLVSPKLRPPFGIVLGSPREAAALVQDLPEGDTVCYQMDLHQADRLRDELSRHPRSAAVATHPDLWDVSAACGVASEAPSATPQAAFQTIIYPVPYGGERFLKLDMIEQAYHVLKPHGTLVVLSPYDKEDFFPPVLKKVFGKVHVPMDGDNTVFWCQYDGERPRRRHEQTYHVRVDETTSYCFTSRPGVFGYGFFDEGGRALTEVMELQPGQRVLDLGCGVGTNGILAARQVGPEGFIAFADSNVRAIALAELNAKTIGLTNYQAVATHALTDWPDGSFDVVLANPPYYAHGSINRFFIERAKALLKPGGSFYLVTKQVDATWPVFQEHFAEPGLFENRGYVIFRAEKP
jgi:16S rRNA G1207 methylase RsmC